VTIVIEDRHPSIDIIDEAMLTGYLTGCADFIRINGEKEIETFPLTQVVKNILSLQEWEFPKLLGLTETPVIKQDGIILTYSGYDVVTGLYYYPGSLLIPPISDKPSQKELKRAIKLVLDPFTDFPFSSDADKANAIAILLTLILRTLFSGRIPLALFDKPQPGTGASLLTDIISIISSGQQAQMMSPPRNEEEWKKLIFSILKKGQVLGVIDNLATVLQGEALSTALTEENYQGRNLGHSEALTLPSHTIWMVTGNNIQLGGDLPRRSIWIRMDAKVPQPWLRKMSHYKHSDLKKWVTEKRGDILGAILLIGRAWILAGKPKAANSVDLGGFDDWACVIGDILAFIGIHGFLTNIQSMYAEMDSEGPIWAAFEDAWYGLNGDKPITTAELIGLLDNNAELSACLPIAREEKKDFARMLGRVLSKKQEVRYPNGLMLHNVGKDHKVIRWQVIRYANPDNSQNNPQPLPSEGGYGGLKTVEALQPNESINQNLLPIENDHLGNNSSADPVTGSDNPLNPLTPSDDTDDDELADEQSDEEDSAKLKSWELTLSDLLHENEHKFIDPANPNAAGIKIHPDAKWKGKCTQCGLTWSLPLPLSVIQRIDVECPKCGNDEISWSVDKIEVISSATLRERIPEFIESEWGD